MTQPRGSAPRQGNQQASSAAASAALSGAVDLSGLKQRADATRRQSPASPDAQGAGGPAQQGGAGSASSSSTVVDVTEATFQQEVVDRSMNTLVVVDLWADWCQPCKQLSPVLERLAAEYNGAWVLAKIDVDANQRIPQLFGVQSLPTVVGVGGGQPVDAFQGALSEQEIRQWLDSMLDNLREKLPGIAAAEQAAGQTGTEAESEDTRFTEAEEAIARGDFEEAQAAYQRILDAEPHNEQAKAAMNQVQFAARAASLDPEVVSRADANPDDIDAQIEAADLAVASQELEHAFTRLINTVRRSGGEDQDRARNHLLELFELFDPADERVTKARRELASALF